MVVRADYFYNVVMAAVKCVVITVVVVVAGNSDNSEMRQRTVKLVMVKLTSIVKC